MNVPAPKNAREERHTASYAPEELDTLTLVFSKSVPHAGASADDDDPNDLQEQHLAHLASMFQRGALAVAGPVARNDDDALRGLCIYRSGIDEATALASADPAVRAGHLLVEARLWRMPAGYISFPKQGVPYLQRLLHEGKLLLAGPSLDPPFGIIVLVAQSQDEAWDLVRDDPSVSAGVQAAELHPFRTSLLAGRDY